MFLYQIEKNCIHRDLPPVNAKGHPTMAQKVPGKSEFHKLQSKYDEVVKENGILKCSR